MLDGSSINEMLLPASLTTDGITGFGTPWYVCICTRVANTHMRREYWYSGDAWTVSKAGSFPGYRTQLALLPDIKVGLFVAALLRLNHCTHNHAFAERTAMFLIQPFGRFKVLTF